MRYKSYKWCHMEDEMRCDVMRGELTRWICDMDMDVDVLYNDLVNVNVAVWGYMDLMPWLHLVDMD